MITPGKSIRQTSSRKTGKPAPHRVRFSREGRAPARRCWCVLQRKRAESSPPIDSGKTSPFVKSKPSSGRIRPPLVDRRRSARQANRSAPPNANAGGSTRSARVLILDVCEAARKRALGIRWLQPPPLRIVVTSSISIGFCASSCSCLITPISVSSSCGSPLLTRRSRRCSSCTCLAIWA